MTAASTTEKRVTGFIFAFMIVLIRRLRNFGYRNISAFLRIRTGNTGQQKNIYCEKECQKFHTANVILLIFMLLMIKAFMPGK